MRSLNIELPTERAMSSKHAELNKQAITACIAVLKRINCVYVKSDKVSWRVMLGTAGVRWSGEVFVYAKSKHSEHPTYECAKNACQMVAIATERLFVEHKSIGVVPWNLHVLLLDHIWNKPEVAHIIAGLELAREAIHVQAKATATG